MIQSLVELQRLLWLNSPILDWQALFQLLQKNFMPAPMGAATAICCLCSLLSSHYSSLFSSLLWTSTFTAILQLLRPTAAACWDNVACPYVLLTDFFVA